MMSSIKFNILNKNPFEPAESGRVNFCLQIAQVRNELTGKEVNNFLSGELALIISIGYCRHIHCFNILLITHLVAKRVL